MRCWRMILHATCPVCNCTITYDWTHTNRKAYGHCPQCFCVSVNPTHILDHTEEKSRYNQHQNSMENRGYVEYLTTFGDRTIRKYLPPPAGVLDFGSGPTPTFGELLTSWGYRVTLYDYYFAPGEHWRDQRYQGITSIEVFEHLHDPLGAIGQLTELLEEGGYLFLRTLLHYNDAERFHSWWYPIDETHITFFHEKTFEYMAKQCKLSVVSIQHGCEIILQKQ